MKTFHLTIAHVGENLFDGEAVSVSLPGNDGTFEVLAEHEAFVSLLKHGTIHLRTSDNQKQSFDVPISGVAEVSLNQATVLL